MVKQGIHLGDQEQLINNLAENSIDAIITDPPYGLKWDHKIETHFNFENFISNAHRVLKDNGFLVYFGQEPTMSEWNSIAQKKFNYIAEIIWYKRGNSSPFHFPLRVHEKIMIFTKGKGKLNKATVDWEWEKEETLEYVNKSTILRAIGEVKRLLKTSNDIDELRSLIADNKYEITENKSKVNDEIYKMSKYKINKYSYIFNPKKLTTLWGCRPHNHQGYNKEEFNVKHPTVKPIQIMERLIDMTTKDGDIVLDTFMGSGSTGIACKNMNRKFIGYELLEEYYNIAKIRLKND